jgi:hypothetical protein
MLAVGIGDEARDKIHQEVGDTSMPRVLDLTDILELGVDGFDVTVANSKIAPLPPQAGVDYPASPEGEMQKGKRSRCRPAHPLPPLCE